MYCAELHNIDNMQSTQWKHRTSHAHRPTVVRGQRMHIIAAASDRQRQKDNAVVVGLVSAMTESLRLLGVGRDRYEQVVAASGPVKRLRKGDISGVINRIKGDFKQGYIITGIIDDTIYEEQCFFADPTVSFSGLQLWKRNLALLTPFLIEPSVNLRSIKRTGRDEQGRDTLRAEWQLQTYLSLPWRPFISILGATDYTLNGDSNQVIEHVESWNVTGLQALAQMFRPGNSRQE